MKEWDEGILVKEDELQKEKEVVLIAETKKEEKRVYSYKSFYKFYLYQIHHIITMLHSRTLLLAACFVTIHHVLMCTNNKAGRVGAMYRQAPCMLS